MTRCADEKTLEIKGATTVLKLGGLSAGGASRGGVGRGCPLPTGRGPCPLPKFFFHFLSENGEFWCILGGDSALYV